MAITKEQLEELWYTSITNAEIERLLGLEGKSLVRLKQEFGLPDRPTHHVVDPDEDTIAARCAEVQAGWTAGERKRRLVGGPTRWRPPNFTMDARFRVSPAAVLR